MNRMLVLSMLCLGLAACQTSGKLERKVAAAEQRLSVVQEKIAAATAPIGQPGKDLRAELSYDPIVQWTQLFSAAPEASRTFRFQQTDRSGNLVHQSHRCRLFGTKRDGYWARIDEARSTRATLLLKSLTAQPQGDGLAFTMPMDFQARSQIAANFRARCQPVNVGTSIGVTGESRPNGVFKFKFDGMADNALRYSLDLVSPDRINVEVAGHIGDIGRVRFTIPMDNIAQHLMNGEVGLLVATGGELRLPDGRQVKYTVATRNPTLAHSQRGVTVESDFDVLIEADALSSAP